MFCTPNKLSITWQPLLHRSSSPTQFWAHSLHAWWHTTEVGQVLVLANTTPAKLIQVLVLLPIRKTDGVMLGSKRFPDAFTRYFMILGWHLSWSRHRQLSPETRQLKLKHIGTRNSMQSLGKFTIAHDTNPATWFSDLFDFQAGAFFKLFY